jgi:hypothetical protein
MAGKRKPKDTEERCPRTDPEAETLCEPGTHSERLYYPEVPPDEWHPKKRIEKMREAGADRFEIEAAEYDYAEGDITHGKQLSRGLTPQEEGHGQSQMILAVCTVCRQKREIDQAPSPDRLVEAKDQEARFGGTNQIRNNRRMAEQNRDVTYKIPESQLHQRRTDTLREFARVVGIPSKS